MQISPSNGPSNGEIIVAWIGIAISCIGGFSGNTALAVAGFTIVYGALNHVQPFL